MADNKMLIAAIKDEDSLKRALKSNVKYLFLLKGNICNIDKIIKMCHKHDKKVFIHIDMIEGFGKDEASVKYISEYIKPDGIITTKYSLVTYAKKYNLNAVFRVFIVDTQSIESAISNINKCKAKYVEIMPGIIPELIGMLSARTDASFIAGGLVTTKKHVEEAFISGAKAVSTSNEDLWKEFS